MEDLVWYVIDSGMPERINQPNAEKESPIQSSLNNILHIVNTLDGLKDQIKDSSQYDAFSHGITFIRRFHTLMQFFYKNHAIAKISDENEAKDFMEFFDEIGKDIAKIVGISSEADPILENLKKENEKLKIRFSALLEGQIETHTSKEPTNEEVLEIIPPLLGELEAACDTLEQMLDGGKELNLDAIRGQLTIVEDRQAYLTTWKGDDHEDISKHFANIRKTFYEDMTAEKRVRAMRPHRDLLNDTVDTTLNRSKSLIERAKDVLIKKDTPPDSSQK